MKFLNHKIYTEPNKQKGAALIISLIILVVMTMIGVASMGTSLMQEKMASNSQNKNITFQAAESSVGALITAVLGGDQSDMTNAMNDLGNVGPFIPFDVDDPDVTAGYQVTYLGVITLTSGGSLDADESSTTLQAHRFEISATGTVPPTNAQTVINQGIEYN